MSNTLKFNDQTGGRLTVHSDPNVAKEFGLVSAYSLMVDKDQDFRHSPVQTPSRDVFYFTDIVELHAESLDNGDIIVKSIEENGRVDTGRIHLEVREFCHPDGMSRLKFHIINLT